MMKLKAQNMIKDAYTWHAVYEDGVTSVIENDDNSFADVDQARVRQLMLLSTTSDLAHLMTIPANAKKTVFFRRRKIEVNPVDGVESGRATIHCIGWEQENSAVYLFIGENGDTLLSDDLQAI